MNNSNAKRNKKGCPLSSLWHAAKTMRKTVPEPDHCENSEIYCTIEDCFILKELQSLFTQKL